MKAQILFGLLTIISAIALKISMIWAVVGFIIYLVKDNPFNWWSVWIIIISFIVLIVSYVIYTANKQTSITKRPTKSRFTERLEKARRERESNLQ